MPNGSNNWNVSYSTITFVEKALSSHAKVANFVRRDDIVFEIERTSPLSRTTTVLVDRYTLGLADVMQAKGEFPTMDCIVTCAKWNHYTGEAKTYGLENGIAVFDIGEFFGALHRTEMIRYEPPDRDKQAARKSGRRY